MANIVNELYCFYGQKDQLEKLYGLITDDDFYMEDVSVSQIFNIDINNNSFKIEVESNWTSAYHDIENFLAENEIDVSYLLASREEGDMWSFKNDLDSQYIKEDYMVYYFPEDEDDKLEILNERKFFTTTELEKILDSEFGKEESMEYYFDFKRIHKIYCSLGR